MLGGPILMSKTIKRIYFGVNGETYDLDFNKSYDIKTVNIQPDDTILIHLNDELDFEEASMFIKKMNKIFPNNTILPVNELVMKGMTIIRQSKSIGDCIDEIPINKPLEEECPELFKNDYWYWQGGSK
jgi:hypothetical protein